MRKRNLLFLLVLAAPVVVTVTLLYYHQIENDTESRARFVPRPRVDGESVAEIGYILEVRREIVYGERRRSVRWWVKIPSTNKTYSCAWERGYPEFKKDDGVEIIHKKEGLDTVDYSGYIVGLHDEERGQSAEVWAIDMDEIWPLVYE